MNFVVAIYDASRALPSEERFGLTSQLRRASVSIVSNIAEGAARQSKAEFAQFLNMAIGSCSELDTQLQLCHRLVYLSTDRWRELDNQLQQIDRMLIGLRKSVTNR